MNKKALMIIVGSIACGVIAVLLVNFYSRGNVTVIKWCFLGCHIQPGTLFIKKNVPLFYF